MHIVFAQDREIEIINPVHRVLCFVVISAQPVVHVVVDHALANMLCRRIGEHRRFRRQ